MIRKVIGDIEKPDIVIIPVAQLLGHGTDGLLPGRGLGISQNKTFTGELRCLIHEFTLMRALGRSTGSGM